MAAIDYSPYHLAVSILAGTCDWATKNDNVGFNKADTWLGHALASTPVELWDNQMARVAWEMTRKYKGQLAANGLEWDELPVPPKPEGEADHLGERRGVAARIRARREEEARAAARAAKNWVLCEEGGEIILSFMYDAEMVAAARNIPGRRFRSEYKGFEKVNIYPFASLPQVVDFCDRFDIPVAPEVRALVAAARAAAEVEAAKPNVYAEKNKIVIARGWDQRTPALNAALRDYNGGYSTWDKTRGVHVVNVRDVAKLRRIFEEFGLILSDGARKLLDEVEAKRSGAARLAVALHADPVEVPGLAGELMPHQYVPVRFAAEHRRVILGDDMGLGKTLSSLAAVAHLRALPVIIVCRPSLTLNWKAEVERFFPTWKVTVLEGTTPYPVPHADAVIIGTVALATVDKNAPKVGGKPVFPWVRELAAFGAKAVIVDESQDTKEDSNRSLAVEQLTAPLRRGDGVILLLTGTAIINRPRELLRQLKILGREGEFGGSRAFLRRYCSGRQRFVGGRWVDDYSGAHHLRELHSILLGSGIMCRRTEEALHLPPLKRPVEAIPADRLDTEVMDEYRKAEKDTVRYLAAEAMRIARELGKDPASAAVQARMKAKAAEHLVRINALRKLAAKAKLPYVREWVDRQVAAGEKVVVAAHHREIVSGLAKRYDGLLLQGGQSAAEKEAHKARFQTDPDARVMVVAIGAGGVGHTLTAARIGVLAELPWTPGDVDQMIKRIHRIGQTRPCAFTALVAAGTIDEKMAAMIEQKGRILRAVLNGEADEGVEIDEGSAAAQIAWDLAKQGLYGD